MKYVDYIFLCIVAFFMTIGEKAESMNSWINVMFPFYLLATVFYYTPEHLLDCLIIIFFKWITSLFTSYHFTFILQNNELEVAFCILTVWLELI